jgi:hypothetical protein
MNRLLTNLFRKHRLDRDLDAELQSHLQLHIDDNLRAGMCPEEARRVGLLKLGGLAQTKQLMREQQSLPLVECLLHDACFALRVLRKSPAFTSIAIATLALGIGANTAIFSVVNSVLLRSLPFPHPNELVYLHARSTFFDFPSLGVSLPDIADVRNSATSFLAMAIHRDAPKELSAEGGAKPQRLESTEVTEDFFPILGIRPLHGRVFTSADMQPGHPTVVLSYDSGKKILPPIETPSARPSPSTASLTPSSASFPRKRPSVLPPTANSGPRFFRAKNNKPNAAIMPIRSSRV